MKKWIITILLLCLGVRGYTEEVKESVKLVAYTIWAEARGEGSEGMHCVATVIWNLAEGDPAQLEEIVLVPYKFSALNGKDINNMSFPEGDDIYNNCILLASCMSQGRFKPAGPWNAYYNWKRVSPWWRTDMIFRKQVGRHVFGLLE